MVAIGNNLNVNQLQVEQLKKTAEPETATSGHPTGITEVEDFNPQDPPAMFPWGFLANWLSDVGLSVGIYFGPNGKDGMLLA